MPLPSIKKVVCGQGDVILAVKWNFMGGQLSHILSWDVAICPQTRFLMLGNCISLILVSFSLFCFLNWLFAAIFSNCSNSLNFVAKIICNIVKPNVPKCRKTCTDLKYDLPHFYGSQSHILSGDTFEGPCTTAFLQLNAQNCLENAMKDYGLSRVIMKQDTCLETHYQRSFIESHS